MEALYKPRGLSATIPAASYPEQSIRRILPGILKTIGIPPKLVDIIKTLYSSTHSVVRVNGTISEAFSISSGVRQGCVLAANLFNTATDRILNNTTHALTLGVNYDDSGQLITDLDYADDIVIFADLLDTLKDALFICNEQSQKLGLHVNWSKTKLQSFSPWIPTPPSTLIGTQPVTTTDNFTYHIMDKHDNSRHLAEGCIESLAWRRTSASSVKGLVIGMTVHLYVALFRICL